jgi:hypothetical protein
VRGPGESDGKRPMGSGDKGERIRRGGPLEGQTPRKDLVRKDSQDDKRTASPIGCASSV